MKSTRNYKNLNMLFLRQLEGFYMKKIEKNIIIKYEDRNVILPEELKTKITEFWKNAVKENPKLFNGENFIIESTSETENIIEMKAVKSNYSHYLYNERIGIKEEKYRACSPWTGILLQTNDDYFVIGEADSTTSIPYVLQITGGQMDKSDIIDGKLDLVHNLKRELKEEMNLNLDEIDYRFKFIEYPNENRNAYGLIALGMIDKTKEELQKNFEEYRKYLLDNNLETEIGRLVFLKKEIAVEQLDSMQNYKRPYLRELIEIAREK